MNLCLIYMISIVSINKEDLSYLSNKVNVNLNEHIFSFT